MAILTNLALLIVLFSIKQIKRRPYLAVLVLVAVKTIVISFIYKEFTTILGLTAFYAVCGAAAVYCLERLDRVEAAEKEANSNLESPAAQKTKFRWEYIPLTLLVAALLVAEEAIQPLLFNH